MSNMRNGIGNLIQAIEANLPNAVAHLLHCNLASKVPEHKGKTPVEIAASLEHWDCVEAIASGKKTDAMDTSRYGSALLSLLLNPKPSADRKLQTAKKLLEAGALTTYRDEASADSCLHVAAKANQQHIIQLLLEFKSDLTATNLAQQTPIEIAAKNGYWLCVEIIAKHQKDEDGKKGYGNALLEAAASRRDETARILLGAGALTSQFFLESRNSCLHTAVEKRHTAMISLFFEFKRDHLAHLTHQNKLKQTPLKMAASLGYWDCVDTIATITASILTTQLTKQAENKNDVLPTFSETAQCNDVLRTAVDAKQSPQLVEKLLKTGASPNVEDEKGDTCLHSAARQSQTKLIVLLLLFNGNPAHANKEKKIPKELGILQYNFALKEYFENQPLQLMATFIPIVQAQRQEPKKESKQNESRQAVAKFYALPDQVIKLLTQYVTRLIEYDALTHTRQLLERAKTTGEQKRKRAAEDKLKLEEFVARNTVITADSKARTSATAVLNEYTRFFNLKCSTESVQFANELKGLTNDRTLNIGTKIEEKAKAFQAAHQNRKSRMLNLLFKHGLIKEKALGVKSDNQPRLGNK